VADVTVAFEGWNSSTQGWGEGPWGEGVAVPGATGIARFQDANVTVRVSLQRLRLETADANVSVTGLSATGSVGSVTNDVYSISATARCTVTAIQLRLLLVFLPRDRLDGYGYRLMQYLCIGRFRGQEQLEQLQLRNRRDCFNRSFSDKLSWHGYG
jgi:hypothetical protein